MAVGGGGAWEGVPKNLDGSFIVSADRTFALPLVRVNGDEFVPGALSTLVRCGAVRWGFVGVGQAFLTATTW